MKWMQRRWLVIRKSYAVWEITKPHSVQEEDFFLY